MIKFLLAFAICLALAVVPSVSKAVPMQQVYREVQSIIYTCYGGDATGMAAADWYLRSAYGCSLWDFFYAWDSYGFMGAIEDMWAIPY